jgi:hypothetical protein
MTTVRPHYYLLIPLDLDVKVFRKDWSFDLHHATLLERADLGKVGVWVLNYVQEMMRIAGV